MSRSASEGAILLQVTDKAFKGDLQAGKFLVQLSQVAEAITKEGLSKSVSDSAVRPLVS